MLLLITTLILMFIMLCTSSFIAYKLYDIKLSAEGKLANSIKQENEIRGDFWTAEDIRTIKFNFREDFDNNILPLVELHVSDFVLAQVLPHIQSPYFKYKPIDTFIKEHQEYFVTSLLSSVCGTQRKYFSRYMTADTFDLYTSRVAWRLMLVQIKKATVDGEISEEALV